MSLEQEIHELTAAIRATIEPIGRMYFAIGPVTEQNSPVTPTPQYQGKAEGEILVEFTITDSQDVVLSPKFVDKKGQPAKIDGDALWVVDDASKAALVVFEDGSCKVSAIGPLGDIEVSCIGDADLGEGVKKVVLTGTGHITAGEAVHGELTAGAPTEQE